MKQALAKAVKDAKTTAETVANAAGVKITTIYQISPSYNYPIPVYRDFAESKMDLLLTSVKRVTRRTYV